jgi:hypothetical protein
VTTEDHVIAQIAEANPVPDEASAGAQERAEADRILRRVLDDTGATARRRPRLRWGLLAPVVSVLVVVVVAAVILRTGGSSTTGQGGHGGLRITLSAQPSAQTPRVTASVMSREVALMRRRLASLGRGFTVQQSGATGIVVTGPASRAGERARIIRLITEPARLRFYDWEANVLTPNGKTAASQLLTQDGAALSVSEGGNEGPGAPGAGSMPLYDAVKLANKQPEQHDRSAVSRIGPEYFVFGAPGSRACAQAAAVDHTRPVPGAHCLLAGPVDVGSDAGLHEAVAEAAERSPSGRLPGRTEVVVVPQGTVVLQAGGDPGGTPTVPFDSPTAQFFVLRDHVALSGNQITNPTASIDSGGEPAVNFGFTGTGQAAFERVTKQVAQRGANVSLGDTMLNQHFAVAVDDQLVTVPQIDFRQYPDGIIGGGGADITGGFTAQTARDLATELRYGALPLSVRVAP